MPAQGICLCSSKAGGRGRSMPTEMHPLAPLRDAELQGMLPLPLQAPCWGKFKASSLLSLLRLALRGVQEEISKRNNLEEKKKSFPTSPAAWHITRVSTGCLWCCGSMSIPSQRLKKQKDFRTSPRVLGLACTEHWSPSLGWIYTE